MSKYTYISGHLSVELIAGDAVQMCATSAEDAREILIEDDGAGNLDTIDLE